MRAAELSLALPRNDGSLAVSVARRLLEPLGPVDLPAWEADHPALAWRRSGLLELTGRPGGPGLVAPIPLTSLADGLVLALGALAPYADLPRNGAALLGERARRLGLRRRGQVSANGSARLLKTLDGHLALNLVRMEDWESLPALLGGTASEWCAVADLVARQPTADLVAQGHLLGMAIAPEGRPPSPARPFSIQPPLGAATIRSRRPLVVDLSALWAGPLAASLLGAMGARVVKIESLSRPDGARGGDPYFYDLLNGGKASVALDFKDPEGVGRLRALIDAADIVIESTRPRALEQLGIDAASVARRGATWVSVTAYGRTGVTANLIGFGDDTAVAGGASAAMRRGWGESLFVGDAIADPLTGLAAAFAAWASWLGGGGRLVDIALADVIAYASGLGEVSGSELSAWQAFAEADKGPLYSLRQPLGIASPLGADTVSLLSEL
ncbi:CoA transferase [Brevundimonas sp.]|uniref:CoA transferase n=1 Tax=Brevundimonas sp. TaxID=1871086 RepID=UPI001A1A281F|nr:CoA transferase [Brevundimonas sp.]MBJ7483155.1 CoA transferase [Brevundimonas sp.]